MSFVFLTTSELSFTPKHIQKIIRFHLTWNNVYLNIDEIKHHLISNVGNVLLLRIILKNQALVNKIQPLKNYFKSQVTLTIIIFTSVISCCYKKQLWDRRLLDLTLNDYCRVHYFRIFCRVEPDNRYINRYSYQLKIGTGFIQKNLDLLGG